MKIDEVIQFDNDLTDCITDLKDTLHHHRIAVGLAAPQLGIAMKVAVINLKTEKEQDIVIINPEILSNTGKKDKKKESCMSLPHYRGEVERRNKLHIRYQDERGDEKEMRLTGYRARVFLHEIDHLDGLLYTDRMDKSSDLEKVDFFD